MINPTLKLTSIAVGVGGIATGAAVSAYQILKSEEKPKSKITELLASDQLTMLDSSTSTKDGAVWTEKWNKFKQNHETNGPTGFWTIDDWANNKSDEKGLPKFKDLCDTNSKKEVEGKEDELYIAVKDNCTKQKQPAT